MTKEADIFLDTFKEIYLLGCIMSTDYSHQKWRERLLKKEKNSEVSPKLKA